MFIAWTTVPDASVGEQLAKGAVEARLAVCAQVDTAGITSFYRWDGKTAQAREYRVVFKCLPDQLKPLETWVYQHHPYDVPQWLAVRAEHVGEKYLSWAKANSTFPPF